jgi:hypothetical protein
MRPTFTRILLAGALVSSCASSGGTTSQSAAPQHCTMMDCSDQVALSLRAPDGRPPKENLRIEIDADGKTVSCVPTWSAEGEGGTHQCSDEVAVTHQEIRDCKEVKLEHGTSVECKGTGKFENLVEIRSTPRRLRVVVKQNDRQIAEKTLDPKYEQLTPNGPGCPPTCRQSRTTWQL